MIYIFTALYCEARVFIEEYHLKKCVDSKRFQIFDNEDAGVRLVVTGTGNIAAAVAAGCVCTRYGVGSNDFFINAGVCALLDIGSTRERIKPGSAFLCHKIIEQTTGRTFYPDMIYRHSFCEAALVTGAKVLTDVRHEVESENRYVLYDMEAAAIYQAGAYFLAPHQMSFIKVVSDFGSDLQCGDEFVLSLMKENFPKIAAYIETLKSAGGKIKESSIDGDAWFERLCADLCCSQAMRAGIRQYIRYCGLAGIDYHAAVKSLYQDGLLPCRSKREGKVCLDEFKNRLLQ